MASVIFGTLSAIAITLYLLATAGIVFAAYHAIGTAMSAIMLIGMGCFLELRCLLIQWIGKANDS